MGRDSEGGHPLHHRMMLGLLVVGLLGLIAQTGNGRPICEFRRPVPMFGGFPPGYCGRVIPPPAFLRPSAQQSPLSPPVVSNPR